MSDFLGAVLTPFDYVVSAPLLAWHEIFGALDPGWAWALAIVGTAVTVRVLLMPLYVSQLRMRRELRKLEPQIKALEQTYGHDRELLAQEQMKLVKAVGFRPVLSLLPLALLGLVLVVLARMIDAVDKHAAAGESFRRGFLTDGDASSLSRAKVAGGRIADSLIGSAEDGTTVVAAVLIAVMCVTHVIAQRQEAVQLPTPVTPTGLVEQKRQVTLWVLLVGMAAVSLVLSVGVLIFWATSKLWTVGQQRLLRDDPGPTP
ncbi:membrane protein insertase YidC [Aeromicrobium ginsengisoli]|uniref:Membrane protein insertase YidC n=1 Tax=Aeromicrobium ginsengisoli TaxID=363867 RepID=A0A5M4FAI6_9ACTN|nr:membrane protein insertase YidC [Aeromicrobium ginsengisoli]KAA1395354.1 membrane protein insertase YidC [Aeromicrobium ginsengisoli]